MKLPLCLPKPPVYKKKITTVKKPLKDLLPLCKAFFDLLNSFLILTLKVFLALMSTEAKFHFSPCVPLLFHTGCEGNTRPAFT